jgi:hypothetical protein
MASVAGLLIVPDRSSFGKYVWQRRVLWRILLHSGP